MEGFLAGLLGFAIIAIIGFLLLSGVYFKVKENIVEPIQQKQKRTNLANYKFNEFISAVSSIASRKKTIEANENSFIIKEDVTNGFELIGSFIYKIEDDVIFKNNSVGKVKVHSYTISVSCNIAPSVNLTFMSNPLSLIDESICKEIILQLKKKITENTRYKDAIEVHKIK